MRFLKFTIFVLLASVSHVFAQGNVSGKLVDSRNSPLGYATVTLLKADSSVAGGDLSKDNGTFNITPVAGGSYTLKVESIGMASKRVSIVVPDGGSKDAGTIKLDATENTLKGATVTGEKAVMELRVDKKVFNVEKNITTAGGSATDVLQNVPAISVESDGSISLRGKSNVTILIDGKPATLLGADVTSALQSLPAGSIESVEVITNPSAKYDAQGTTGIINIITKKDGRFGMNGSATVGAGTPSGNKYNANLSLNVHKGKWNVFMNSSYRLNETWNNVTTDRKDSGAHGNLYHTYEHVPRAFGGFFNTVGATYDFSKLSNITFTGNVNKMNFGYEDQSDYYVYGPGSDPLTNYTLHQNRNSSFKVEPFSVSGAVDFKKKFKKQGEELNVDATFAAMNATRYQDYTTVVDHGANTTEAPILQRAPGSGGNNSLTAWADYTDPLFTKNGKLGLGVKSQLIYFNSDNSSYRKVSDTTDWVSDLSLQASYEYMQQIHAAYANWNDQIGKFSYQVGLRAEDAIYDGKSKVIDSTYHNSFFNLFPSAFVSYQLPAQQSIYLNYSRRTNRPGFMQLIPFVDLSNPGTVNKGNPGLLPEFINNIEFSYNKQTPKGHNIILSAYYALTENLTERILRKMDSAEASGYGVPTGTLMSQPVNIASGATFGLEGTGRFQLSRIWDATLSANFFRNQMVIGNIDPALASILSNNSGFTWFAKGNTNLKLPKNFSVQLNVNYEAPKVVTQGTIHESYWMDVAVRKNFWNNKATLVLNCSDVFLTRKFITDYNAVTYTQVTDRVKQTRIGNINFTYRFGKTDSGKDIAKGKGGGRPDRGSMKPTKPVEGERENNLKQGDDDNGGGGMGGGQRKEGGGR